MSTLGELLLPKAVVARARWQGRKQVLTEMSGLMARALGLEIAAFSCLTNWAAGMDGPLSHAEVVEVGAEASGALADLLEECLRGR